MDIIIKILQFILSFSLLVIVHELGHFIFAKIFGVRVEKFSLFFGKTIFSFKKGDTTYGVGWIPFGGYVKMAGMIDESMDTDYTASEPQPYEFRSKPAWQRLLIMTGGVIMNIILAFLIYVGMSYTWGDKYVSTQDLKYGYSFSEQAERMGFEDGDKIISVNGKAVVDYSRLVESLLIDQNSDVVVERDGRQLTIRTPETSISKLMEDPDFIYPRFPFVVLEVLPESGAEKAGLMPGDSLIALNGMTVEFFDQYGPTLVEYAGQTVDIEYARESDGTKVLYTIPIAVSAEGMLGIRPDAGRFIPISVKEYTLLQAFPAGFKRVGTEISGYWKQLKLIFKPKTEAYKSLGGPLSIGNIFPSKWNWQSFWSITALLSIILAVMNILPIPALDGGHVVFLLFEMITGRKPGDRFMTAAQLVGMAILFCLMFFATCNDINRLFIK